ncbi:nitrate reductase molybdenum cofactor assembly chaperone [Desulfurispirillum indicum]|uniref:Nitrate reductase molybdenum cofactor assembly chaperone n=1 Tax=Desulfurispirillum indicum (strain ATCC BAA-1389 / DSM 22839 / S5) TaxID=653733 RepID=E6W577_DESIS|nr:nitrate reductase molybdenum cofactor assembly chaperone [Desulfurispirillum indicum]ADU67156.1 nitrate reductase molybdenum cofactor assembly chaperone [Desulfurispirillum indicum S5]UCZ56479.1 nitrate reductase molybdenum cofactor assembly chaperone [Desulfurispirillum indicum]
MITAELYRCFSVLMRYPDLHMASVARQAAQAAAFLPQAAQPLEFFCGVAEDSGVKVMQEAYTAAFDLQPLAAPYVGYHLFGDDARRGQFLIRLQEIYRQRGITPDPGELADHLATVLRFLATTAGSTEHGALARDALLPAVRSIHGALAQGENPYRHILQSLEYCIDRSVTTLCTAPPDVEVFHA